AGGAAGGARGCGGARVRGRRRAPPRPGAPRPADRVRGALCSMRPEGVSMPTVIGHHDVKDTDHWLASPRREEFFGPLGVTNIRTFVDPTNRTRVAVLMDVPDMDAVTAAMESPAAADAMAYDGVLPETLVILVEASPQA